MEEKEEKAKPVPKTAINLADLKNGIENLVKLARYYGEKVNEFTKSIEAFRIKYAPEIAAVIQSLKEIPSDFLEIQEALATRGWFVLAEMPLNDYRDLKTFIDSGDYDGLDQTMIAWTSVLLDETEEELCGLFPKREALIREGFDNHRQRKYASSMTLLLTQADGICLDSLGQIFFAINRNTHLPRAKDVIDDLGVDAFARITLHPILIKSGINANNSQVSNGEFPNSPHRHGILHGTDTDYVSEINSWKIISFVGYMGGVVHKVVDDARASSSDA
jgi:hypothetical protein